jgi:aminoglycoside phosphotransferase (APT) family kinase protein
LNLLPLPGDRCLEALRHALTLVLAPQMQTPLAKHYVALADMVLTRLLAVSTRLPQIEGEYAPAKAGHLQRARAVLESLRHPDTAPAEVDTLAQALERLGAALQGAPADDAIRIRGILRDAVGTDAAARRAFESAVADVASVRPAGEDPGEFAIEPARLEAYLNERYGSSQRVELRTVDQLPGGHSKETILFEIAQHPRLPQSMVIRMDAGRYGTSVTDEFPLLAALHREGLPVPDPLWLEERSDLFGGAFMVTRRMPGAAPGTLWDVGGVSPEIACALADALARIHATPVVRLLSGAATTSQPLVERMLTESEARWRARMPTPSVAMEVAYGWMKEQARRHDVATCLVHGDPGFQNMIVRDGRLECLLDWEFAHAGDPAEDLAYCRPAVEKIMPWPDFLAAYRAAGGPPVCEDRLRFFDIWRCLRNATLAANTLFDLQRGMAGGLEMAAVAVNTYPKLEAQLATSLDRAMAG